MKNLKTLSYFLTFSLSLFLSSFLFTTCTNSDGTLIHLPEEDDGAMPLFYVEATVAGESINQTAGISGVALKSEGAKSITGIEDTKKGSIYNVIETKIGDFIFSFYAAQQSSAKFMLAQPKKNYAEDSDGKLSYSVSAHYENVTGVIKPDSTFWYLNNKLVSKKFYWTDTGLSYSGEEYPQSIALETSYESNYTQKFRQTRYNSLGNSDINGNLRIFSLTTTTLTKVLGMSVTQSNIGFNWDNFVITSTFPIDPSEGDKTHCVTVTDNRNAATSASTCFMLMDASNLNIVSLKAPNFTMTNKQVLKGDFWDRVAISYRYKDGFTYRSDLQPQPATSTYDILDVKDETPIDNKNTTVRSYAIRFNCMLYNAEGKKIELKNGMARIAVQ
ncbi:MAG: hypothetical protein RLZZ292_2106 [Bacteroidota bacterium]|jgi:hypothetical protein